MAAYSSPILVFSGWEAADIRPDKSQKLATRRYIGIYRMVNKWIDDLQVNPNIQHP
jgi:hypothetical protein